MNRRSLIPIAAAAVAVVVALRTAAPDRIEPTWQSFEALRSEAILTTPPGWTNVDIIQSDANEFGAVRSITARFTAPVATKEVIAYFLRQYGPAYQLRQNTSARSRSVPSIGGKRGKVYVRVAIKDRVTESESPTRFEVKIVSKKKGSTF